MVSIDPIAERIFALADKQFPEQKAFAAAIRESPSKVSQWRMGIIKSYSKQLPQIAEVLGTTVQWLVTGEELPPQSQPPTPVAGDGRGRNIVRAAGRDGSYIERTLTDDQLAAIKAIINQLPDATDL